jgi:hypothetical protein
MQKFTARKIWCAHPTRAAMAAMRRGVRAAASLRFSPGPSGRGSPNHSVRPHRWAAHRCDVASEPKKSQDVTSQRCKCLESLARPERFELPTPRFVVCRSIQLRWRGIRGMPAAYCGSVPWSDRRSDRCGHAELAAKGTLDELAAKGTLDGTLPGHSLDYVGLSH